MVWKALMLEKLIRHREAVKSNEGSLAVTDPVGDNGGMAQTPESVLIRYNFLFALAGWCWSQPPGG